MSKRSGSKRLFSLAVARAKKRALDNIASGGSKSEHLCICGHDEGSVVGAEGTYVHVVCDLCERDVDAFEYIARLRADITSLVHERDIALEAKRKAETAFAALVALYESEYDADAPCKRPQWVADVLDAVDDPSVNVGW